MDSRPKTSKYADSVHEGIGRIQRREWWLWATAIAITLLLTAGIVSYAFPVIHWSSPVPETLTPDEVIRGLVGSVFLFDLYIIFQQVQIYRIRRRLSAREEMFRLISENAADMIAVVDASGKRIYNSPSYERILGYTIEEFFNSVKKRMNGFSDRSVRGDLRTIPVEQRSRSFRQWRGDSAANWKVATSG
jgi:PAS domain-containing protein